MFDDDDFLKFFGTTLLLIGLFVGTLAGISYICHKNDCNNLSKIYNTDTVYYFTSGCYIKDSDNYIPSKLFLKSKLITDKGLTINNRNIGE